MKNSTLVTHKCCNPHPWLAGTPSSVWYPIIPCLEPHPMSGTHPLSGTPSPCLEPPSLVWTSIPDWKPHPLSGTPSLVWYATPSAPTPPSCPQCPYPHQGLAVSVWPLTAPYPPDLVQAAPHLELLPPVTLLLPPNPHPIKYHLQRNLGFSEFSTFSDVRLSISPAINLTSRNNIFHQTSKNSQNSREATPFPSIR